MSLRLLPALLLTAGLAAAADPKPTLGDQVAAYCRANAGKTVGGGECAHLASQAIEAVGGAKRAKDKPGDGDYVWGRLVYTVEAGAKGAGIAETGKRAELQPGDVLQFRDTKFQGRKGRGTYTQTAAHHTAVVTGVEGKGAAAVVKVLHQNWGGKRFVIEETFQFGDLTEGWVRAYRPQPK